jgi:hypothetical protein
MYVEERIYTLHPGKTDDYFRNYEEFGLKVQLKHLAHMVGYYATEIGELNLVIHLWGYDDLNERERRRAAMWADPDWAIYVAKNRPYMVSQQSRVMKCAPFFAERLKKMLAATK